MSKFLAEFIGTAILILLGNGVVAGSLLNKSKSKDSGWMVITAGWGFAVLIAIYSVGRFSGAYLNPAVSIGFFIIGKLDFLQCILYIIAQMLGAIFGQLLVIATYKQQYDLTYDKDIILSTFATGAEVRNKLYNIITEAVGTFVLVYCILMINGAFNPLNSFFNPFIVGFVVWSIGLSLGGPTGYAINPARDLGPRLVHHFFPLKNKGNSDWEYAIVPIIGPIIGAIIASLVFIVL